MTLPTHMSALIFGNDRNGYDSYRWNFGSPVGTAVSISYTFLGSVPDYYAGTPFAVTNFQTFSPALQEATRAILDMYSSICNVTFTETSDVSSADVTFGRNDQTDSSSGYTIVGPSTYNTSGGEVVPGSVTQSPLIGDVWIANGEGQDAVAPGQWGWHTLSHEIGHALGLKHPFEGGVTLPTAEDTNQYSIMSYTFHAKCGAILDLGDGYYRIDAIMPSTPMLYDIAALQHLYGANTTTRTGNDSYAWTANSAFFQTIWDAGGVDTIDASNFTLSCSINLNEGTYSSIGRRITEAEKLMDCPFPVGSIRADHIDLLYDGTNNLAIAYGVTIENAKGGSASDVLMGNAVANTLDGGAGNDTLLGGAGNDTYVVDNVGDHVTEATSIGGSVDAGGSDTIRSSVTWTLGNFVENLTLTGSAAINGAGNALANVLTGNDAVNTLTGGAGKDTYVVGAGDVIVETSTLASEIDTVQAAVTWTLGANLENLTLTGSSAINGTGNDLANFIAGNAAANTLTGGAGNDTYVVGAGDLIVETSTLASEIDSVQAAVTWTLGANLENLSLIGSAAINATGNDLANVLTGNAATNTLTGGNGADTYVVGAGDVIVEANTLASEIDTVQTTVSWTLGANLENLSLIGSAAINATGNDLANVLTGNAAANILTGAYGADTLTGGAGADSLSGGTGADVFRYVAAADGGDTISDFSTAQGDKLCFVSANFGALPAGALQSSLLAANAGGTALFDSTRFIFNTTNGVLTYDADGIGAAAGVTVATLNVRTLTAADLVIAAA